MNDQLIMSALYLILNIQINPDDPKNVSASRVLEELKGRVSQMAKDRGEAK